MARSRFIVRGQVQGVGFRWFVWRQAEHLGLKGYVSNLRDGSVEVVAEGDRTDVEALERALIRGPSMARVDRVEKLDVPHEVTLSNSFEIN